MNRKACVLNPTRKPPAEPSEGGFTLIEILIALSIFAVGVLAVASMQITAIQGNATSAGVTDGVVLASQRMEMLMEEAWTSDALNPANNAGAETVATQGRYTIDWSITDDGVFNNTKTVDITVTWTDRNISKEVVVKHVIPRII